MGKKLIAGLLLATGCTAAELDSLRELAATLQELTDKKKPTPTTAVEVTPAPTPTAIATPTPTLAPTKEIEPPPCGKRNPQDGHKRGFTWKPNSDTQKWATAVLPPGAHGPCTFAGLDARHKGEIGGEHPGDAPAREVHILDRWTGERLKKEHGNIIVRCGCWNWSIPNPSVRVD